MSREAVVSPPPRGAQRTIDIVYPAPQIFAAGNNAIGNSWMNRQGLQKIDMGLVTGFGLPPAGTGWTLYRGRICFKQTGAAGAGGYYTTDQHFAITFPQTTDGAGNWYDDHRCWRVVAIFAQEQVTQDNALEVGPNMQGRYNIIAGLDAGFMLGPSSLTDISIKVRKVAGGALTIDQVVKSQIAIADYHAYEMRFIGATKTSHALFKAYVDNVHVFEAAWGPGTLLPDLQGNSALLGYGIGIGNRGQSATYLAMCGLQVSTAATEAGLL